MIWAQGRLAAARAQPEAEVAAAGLLGQRLKDAGAAVGPCAGRARRCATAIPASPSALDRLRAAGCDRILVRAALPAIRGEHDRLGARRGLRPRADGCAGCPALRSIDGFHDDPGYIQALAQNVNDYWMKHGRPERLVLSFHGLPRRTLDLGDPYHCHCQKTARLLAAELGLDAKHCRGRVPVALRQGRVAEALYRGHARRACQGGHRRASTWSARDSSPTASKRWRRSASRASRRSSRAGGREFHVIPCLNEHPLWIAALADHRPCAISQGWLAAAAGRGGARATRLRAEAMGAQRNRPPAAA